MIEYLSGFGISSKMRMKKVQFVSKNSATYFMDESYSSIGINLLDDSNVSEGIVHFSVSVPVMSVVEKYQIANIRNFMFVQQASFLGEPVEERDSSFSGITLGKIRTYLHSCGSESRKNESGTVFPERGLAKMVSGMDHEIPGGFCKGKPATIFQMTSCQGGVGDNPGRNPTLAPVENRMSENFGTPLFEMLSRLCEDTSGGNQIHMMRFLPHGPEHRMPETCSDGGGPAYSSTATAKENGRYNEKVCKFHGDRPPMVMISKM